MEYDFAKELSGDMSGSAISGTVVTGIRWVTGIIATFIGGVMLLLSTCTYNEVTATSKDMASVKTQLQIQGQQYDREFRRIDAHLAGHDQRLTSIERGESSRQSNAHSR